MIPSAFSRNSFAFPMCTAIHLPVGFPSGYIQISVSPPDPRGLLDFLYQCRLLGGSCYSSIIQPENPWTIAIMHFPVLFFAAFSICSIATAHLHQGRQVASTNSSTDNLIAQCAPNPFTVHQFTTFSGSDTAPPQISFFFTNENGVDVNEGAAGDTIFCSVTLPNDDSVMSDDAVWSCQVGFSPSSSLQSN